MLDKGTSLAQCSFQAVQGGQGWKTPRCGTEGNRHCGTTSKGLQDVRAISRANQLRGCRGGEEGYCVEQGRKPIPFPSFLYDPS
jgi:hypothetical protein